MFSYNLNGEFGISQWQCPLCGKIVSVSLYDPSDFDDDILLIQVRGLGRGKGFEVAENYSLLDGDNPELLDLISDRVAVLYDLLYDDIEEEHEDIINDFEEDIID